MANYITIDGGTTNTRVSLVKDYEIIGTVKISLGARSGIDSKEPLKNAIKDGIEKLLSDNDLSECDITRILAAGMITSEFGLYRADHITVPAGIGELHDTMVEVKLDEISEIPFVFIRGVKTVSDKLEETDMMRGEEAELIGIMNTDDGECVYILPGSHSKIIIVDSKGRITQFSTMLTGEMIASLSSGTILKGTVDLSCDKTDDKYLIQGYKYCIERGINEALFKVRILKNLFNCTTEEAYSFFIGVVLADEINAVLKVKADKVVIGGRKQIKEAMSVILKAVSDKTVVSLSEDEVDKSSSFGMIKIYEY